MCSAASPPTPLYSHARTAPAAATPARPTPPPRRETRPHSGIVHEAPSGPGGRLPAVALPFVAFEGRASPLLAGRVVLLEICEPREREIEHARHVPFDCMT